MFYSLWEDWHAWDMCLLTYGALLNDKGRVHSTFLRFYSFLCLLCCFKKKKCFILACSTQVYSSWILVSFYPWSSTFYLKVCEPRVWRKTTNCPFFFSVPSRHGTRRVSTVKSARWCSLLITSWVTRKSRTVTRKCLIASPHGLASGFQKVANWGIWVSATGWTLCTPSGKDSNLVTEEP